MNSQDLINSLESLVKAEVGHSVFKKDVAPHFIGGESVMATGIIETDRVPLSVLNFLGAFKKVQETTALSCIRTAEWLEMQAADLRNKAATLNHQASQIPDDVKYAATFEREASSLNIFLSALRNPKPGG